MRGDLSRQTLCDQVLARLQSYIVERGLNPGDLLPPERDLALALGVSRNTLREALGRMEVIGALERRTKRGSVLQRVDFAPLAAAAEALLLRTPADLADLFVARRVLELGIIPLVAANLSDTVAVRMEQANEWMEREIDAGRVSVQGDAAFHRALLDATENQFLVQFGVLLEHFFRNVRSRLLADERESRRSVAEHRVILEALRQGNAASARRAMEEHLDAYLRRGVILESGQSARSLPLAADECRIEALHR